jgi:tetratricopeptide (TPR) repeat protein
MERFIEAAAYFERALNASSGMDLHIEGQSLHLLGNALLRLGQLKEAVQRFHQALLIQRQIGDRYGEAETLRSLAHAQRQLNDLNGSRESLRSALSIFQALDDPQAHATQVELEQLARR